MTFFDFFIWTPSLSVHPPDSMSNSLHFVLLSPIEGSAREISLSLILIIYLWRLELHPFLHFALHVDLSFLPSFSYKREGYLPNSPSLEVKARFNPSFPFVSGMEVRGPFPFNRMILHILLFPIFVPLHLPYPVCWNLSFYATFFRSSLIFFFRAVPFGFQ